MEAPPPEHLPAGELRSRAASGAALLGARGALIYAVGVVANLALARLLVPRDFGLVALGTVVLMAGSYAGESGVGAALIRREEAPSRQELGAVTGFQLALTLFVTAVAAVVALPFGRDGLVVAAMVAALPLMVLRAPSVIVLERRLEYGPIAATDVVEALSYYSWAIVTVALGMGVWGLASATVVRALLGTVTMAVMGPLGLVRPRWSWRAVRPLLAFGAKFQATGLVALARIQGLNVVVAAVAGVATLGVWNLAWRVLQIPALLFTVVGRVAYPAMSRLMGTGEDPRAAIERSLAALAVVTGFVIVALVGLAPALPEIVGDDWGDVPAVLLWSGVALVLSAPVTVATAGYLLAADRAGTVATAAFASAIAWFCVTVPLLPSIGAPAVGIGWIAAGIVDGALLARAARVHTRARPGADAVAATVVALLATAAAWLISDGLGASLPAAAAGTAAGELLVLAGFALASRPALRDTRTLVALALRSFRRAPAAVSAEP